MNVVKLFSFLIVLCPAAYAGLTINELLAKNDGIIADQNGEFDDCIELYNDSNQPAALGGFFLTDDYRQPARWAFPDTTLPAQDYMIVWVDDDADVQAGLHTNFKLSASGDAIYIFDNNRCVVDKVVFGVQSIDFSTGRFPDGSGNLWEMTPSLGEPNSPVGLAETDSSQFLFDEISVHSIDLHFYVDNWQDALKASFEGEDRDYIPVRFTFDRGTILDSVGVRYKGNSSYTLSRSSIKKPFKFRFDKYIENQTLLDLLKLNLSNGISDPTFMREKLALSILGNFMPAPRTSYATLSVDGEPIGFYVLVEQVDRQFLLRHFDDPDFPLFKANNSGATLEYNGTSTEDYQEEISLKTDEDEDDWTDFIKLIDVINNRPGIAFENEIQSLLNVETAVRLLAVNMALSNFDSYTGSGRNFYLFEDLTNGRFHFIPWDFNESFGVYKNGWNVITQDIDAISNLEQRPLIKEILESDSLKRLYWSYLEELVNGPASSDSLAAFADRLKPMIESFVAADEHKLYDYEYFISGIDSDVTVELGRTIPGLKSFTRARNQEILAQLSLDRVYPGDTNNDGIVDEYDILLIAVHFLIAGQSRSLKTFAFSPQRAILWDSIPATYADANGDGLVDEKDIVGIGVNWGKTHRPSDENSSFSVDDEILTACRGSIMTIYRSLPDNSAAYSSMRNLLSGILGVTDQLPQQSILYPNYPNPFNSATCIGFYIGQDQTVSLSINNLLGQTVVKPYNQVFLKSGYYNYYFSAEDIPAGAYYYRLITPDRSDARMMIHGK